MGKMSRVERAKQFMPFASLRGFGTLIKEQEVVIADKKELTEEQEKILSETICSVKKGMIVCINYYKEKGYTSISGLVTSIDLVLRTIDVIKTKIKFEDIYDIKIEEQ